MEETMSQEQFGFFVHIQVKPGSEHEFLTGLNQNLDKVRVEPAFINCFILQDEEDPTKFVLYEIWEGTREDFFNVQMTQPYRQPYEESLTRLLAKPRDIQTNWRILRSATREEKD